MIDNAHDPMTAILARFKKLEIDTNDPKWSSWLLDRMFEEVLSTPGGSLQDLYQGLDAALKTYAVELTEAIANLIKDVVVKGFSQPRAAYDAMTWDWANEALQNGASAARCYLFLHALPPDAAMPQSISAIMQGLEGTRYQQEAANTLSEDLGRPEVQRLLASKESRAGLASTSPPPMSNSRGHAS